jgi:hypothetical protein
VTADTGSTFIRNVRIRLLSLPVSHKLDSNSSQLKGKMLSCGNAGMGILNKNNSSYQQLPWNLKAG